MAQEQKSIKGWVTLKNIGIRYGDKNIFENLNLELHTGEKIAIFGKSGIGKTHQRSHNHQLVRKRIENLSDLRYPAETPCKPSVNDISDTGKYKYSGCRGKSVRIVCKENVCKRKYESYTYRRENIRNIFKFHPCLR